MHNSSCTIHAPCSMNHMPFVICLASILMPPCVRCRIRHATCLKAAGIIPKTLGIVKNMHHTVHRTYASVIQHAPVITSKASCMVHPTSIHLSHHATHCMQCTPPIPTACCVGMHHTASSMNCKPLTKQNASCATGIPLKSCIVCFFFGIMCHASCSMNRESFPPACTTNHALSTFLAMHTCSFDHAPYLRPRTPQTSDLYGSLLNGMSCILSSCI